MDPSKPLAVYTKKQKRCQAFAADASNPISMVDIMQMGVTHALATGVMHDAYPEWKCIPKPEQTWNHWKEHFNDAMKRAQCHQSRVNEVWSQKYY